MIIYNDLDLANMLLAKIRAKRQNNRTVLQGWKTITTHTEPLVSPEVTLEVIVKHQYTPTTY